MTIRGQIGMVHYAEWVRPTCGLREEVTPGATAWTCPSCRTEVRPPRVQLGLK